MSFGRFVKELRITGRMTLRRFCKKYGHYPSNWSKIERDINPPPRDDTVTEEWARRLGLSKGTELWQRFMDEAAIARKQIPKELLKVRNAYRPDNQGQVPAR